VSRLGLCSTGTKVLSLWPKVGSFPVFGCGEDLAVAARLNCLAGAAPDSLAVGGGFVGLIPRIKLKLGLFLSVLFFNSLACMGFIY
jgi:hypothetical protein